MIFSKTTKPLQKLLLVILTIFLFLSVNYKSLAAGYSTGIYSTSGLGNAYAGSVTGVHDVSDVFFNPSVTAGLEKNQFIASVTYLNLNIKTNGGSNSGDAGVNKIVPAFYLSTPINNKTSFNLAVTSPFGLATKYDQNWVGRYLAIESSVTTINVNPSLSYKISDQFYIGAGVMAQQYEATLSKGTSATTIAEMNGNDWGYGYNLGISYKFNDKLKFGVGYRSKIEHKLNGTISNGGVWATDFNAKTTTPESLTAGASYKLNKMVELAYDTTWTRWSRLKSLTVRADQNSIFNETNYFNWHDSFLHSVGANFAVNKNSIIRTGLAYEKDGITNANREPRVPGSDRVWASLGFNHKMNNGWIFDGAYSHQFFREAKTSRTDINNSLIMSRYKTTVDVFSIALRKDF